MTIPSCATVRWFAPFRRMLALLSLALLLAAAGASADPEQQGLTYTLTDTYTSAEGNTGSTTLHVQQLGHRAVGRVEAGGPPSIVSDPANGVRSARLDDMLRLPLMVEFMDIPADLQVGSLIPLEPDRFSRVESIEFGLQPGNEDTLILGKPAKHNVLTIELEWSSTQGDGSLLTGRALGSTDLWTINELPFSWLPYTIPVGFPMAAVPLSFSHPQVASHVLNQLAEDLLELGLLVRAKARSSLHRHRAVDDFRFDENYTREVTMDNLQVTDPDMDLAVPDVPTIVPGRYIHLVTSLLSAGEQCSSKPADTSFSLQSRRDQNDRIAGGGQAVVLDVQGTAGATAMVLGSLDPQADDPGDGCVVIVAMPEGLEPGSYALTPDPLSQEWIATHGPRAAAYYVRGSRADPRITLVERGTLEIVADGGELKATLDGAGWSALLSADAPAIHETVGIKLSFGIFGGTSGTEREPAAAAGQIEPPLDAITVADPYGPWSPGPFDPTAREPAAEWTFGGEAVRFSAIDARGRLGAVTMRDKPIVMVLDLEHRTDLHAIEIKPNSAGYNYVSVDFEPSGTRLAIGMSMGTVWVVDPRSGETLQALEFSPDGRMYTDVSKIAFDEAGNRILGSTSGHVVVWDIGSGEPVYRWQQPGRVNELRVTPDGRYAVIAGADVLSVRDLGSGEELCSLPGGFAKMAIHPGGGRLATWNFEKQVVIVDNSNCSEIGAWPAEPGFVPGLAWAADGAHVILASSDGPLHVYEAATGKLVDRWPAQDEGSLVVSAPASTRVLSTGVGKSAKALLWE